VDQALSGSMNLQPNLGKENPLKLQVKQSDITEGKQRDCGACAIARSVQRVLRSPFSASVGRFNVWIMKTEQDHDQPVAEHRIDAPAEFEPFIRSFDGGTKTEPFDFQLPIPAQYLKGGK
jgi:hypothetical protein